MPNLALKISFRLFSGAEQTLDIDPAFSAYLSDELNKQFRRKLLDGLHMFNSIREHFQVSALELPDR